MAFHLHAPSREFLAGSTIPGRLVEVDSANYGEVNCFPTWCNDFVLIFLFQRAIFRPSSSVCH